MESKGTTYEPALRSAVREDDDSDDDDDGHADAETDPLLLACGAGLHRSLLELNICLDHVLLCVLGVLLDVLDHGVLLDDDGVEVLEELRELDHGALDLLDRVVALLHRAQRRLGLPAAVGGQERLLEDLRVAAGFADFAEFGLGCVRVDD